MAESNAPEPASPHIDAAGVQLDLAPQRLAPVRLRTPVDPLHPNPLPISLRRPSPVGPRQTERNDSLDGGLLVHSLTGRSSRRRRRLSRVQARWGAREMTTTSTRAADKLRAASEAELCQAAQSGKSFPESESGSSWRPTTRAERVQSRRRSQSSIPVANSKRLYYESHFDNGNTLREEGCLSSGESIPRRRRSRLPDASSKAIPLHEPNKGPALERRSNLLSRNHRYPAPPLPCRP